jgi:hypothetical protein
MTSVELIESVAKKSGIHKSLVARIFNMLLSEMSDALKDGEPVKLRAFGTLTPTVVGPMSYFGGKQKVGPRVRVRFKSSRRSKWRSSESSTKTKQ